MVSAAEHVGFCEPHAMLASSIHVLYRNIYSSAFCLIPVDSWVLRPGHLAQHAPTPLPTGCQWRTEVCRFLVYAMMLGQNTRCKCHYMVT